MSWQITAMNSHSTSAAQARRGPTAVLLPRDAAGLNRESVALCHQVTTLDRAKLSVQVGMLSKQLIGAVNDGVRAALALV